MVFGGELIFRGAKALRWIKKTEDGNIELVFCSGHAETVLMFEPTLFESVARAIKEFQETGKTTHDIMDTEGTIEAETYFYFEDEEKPSLKITDLRDDTTDLLVKGQKGSMSLTIEEGHVKQYSQLFKKIATYFHLRRECSKAADQMGVAES